MKALPLLRFATAILVLLGFCGGWDLLADEPCVPVSYTTNCTEGSVTLTGATASPTPLCIGVSMTASCNPATQNGVIIITPTACTNSMGPCPCGPPTTNNCTPGMVTNWWVVGGVTASPQSGPGIYAQFQPNSKGNGTVMFNYVWQHCCDTGTSTATASASFTAQCPDWMSTTIVDKYCGSWSGASFKYCFSCPVPGSTGTWWFNETVQITSSNCASGTWNTTKIPTALNLGCWTDYILDETDPQTILDACGCSSCTDQSTQTINLGPDQNSVGICTYDNTQTLTVTSGTVITSSGGQTARCLWSGAQ